uniref:protocadherin-1-like isoform X2 n=1 Tax=Myxine glutinosa TaxID=7769 RepID=UPI00358F82CA
MADTGFVFLLGLILMLTWHDEVNASELRYKVKENQEPEQYIGSLALDLKLDNLESLSFGLMSNPEERRLLRVDVETGQIWTIEKLDREELCADIVPCELKRQVTINPSPNYVYPFVLEVQDVNDNSPTFGDIPLELTILEDVDVGRSFQLPSATDADAPPFGVMTYQLFRRDGGDGNVVGPFSLTVTHNQNGDGPIPYLRVDEKLDREQQKEFQLVLRATDGGNPSPKEASEVLRVIVADVNDHAPVFHRGAEIRVQIKEGVPIGTEVIRLNATDEDAGEYGRVSYKFDTRLSLPRSVSLFAIDSETGVVTVAKDLDRESTEVHDLIVVASDAANPPLSTTTTVSVTLLDINDNKPKILIYIMGTSSLSAGNLEVEENQQPSVSLAVVSITDDDGGEAGQVECTLKPLWGDAAAPLLMKDIGNSQFMLQTVRLLDRETQAEYRANIVATDHGDPPLTSQLELTLQVLDQNDNDPVFSLSTYSAQVYEDLPVGSTIITVSASDNDYGPNAEVRFRFNDSNDHQGLDIDPNSGVVTVVKPGLDREMHDVLNLSVLAVDQGKPSRVSSTNIMLTILDVNDNSPEVFGNPLRFDVSENQLPGTEVGNVLLRDPDQGDKGLVSLKLLQASEMFQLIEIEFSQGSGSKSATQRWRLSTLRSLDREVNDLFNLPILAEDHGVPSRSSSANITVRVTDENDHSPVIVRPSDNTSDVFVAMDSTAGKSLFNIVASDKDIGQNADLSYLFISGNTENIFDLDRKTGELKLQKAAKSAGVGLYRLVVKVHDGGTPNEVSLPGIIHVWINQTSGNRSLIEDMKTRSMSLPIEDDVVLGRKEPGLPLWVYLACGIGLLVLLLVVGLCIVLLCCKKDKKGAGKQKAPQGKRKQRTNRAVTTRGSISEEPLSLQMQGLGFGSSSSPDPLSPDRANFHFASRFGSSRKRDRTDVHVTLPTASHGVIQKLPLENTFVEGKTFPRSHGPDTVDQAPFYMGTKDYSEPHDALDVNAKLPDCRERNRHSMHDYQEYDPGHYQDYPDHYQGYPGHYQDAEPGHYQDEEPGRYQDYEPGHYQNAEPGRYHDYEPGRYHDYESGHHQDFDPGDVQEHANLSSYELLTNPLMNNQPLYNLPLDSAPFSTFGSHTSPDMTYTCLPPSHLGHNVPMTDL